MCKKFEFAVLIFSAICAIQFFSCSSDSSIDLSSGSEETLRQLAAKKEEEMLWTRELESVRLTKEINTSSKVSTNIKLSPEIYAVSNSDFLPIYPSLSGFGSLDTTEINSELKNFLVKFADSVCSWKLDSSLVKESSVFSLVIFKNDVENNWESFFGKKFEITDDISIFDSYIFGEPFAEENSVIVPIRFKNSSGYLDIHLFIDKTDGFKIAQIFIQNWGK